jgi:uncharacterized membrane protein YdbT with pleckstrin-like domain
LACELQGITVPHISKTDSIFTWWQSVLIVVIIIIIIIIFFFFFFIPLSALFKLFKCVLSEQTHDIF